MNSDSTGLELNIPARIKGWLEDGGATVEILSASPPYDIGALLKVSLRRDSSGRLALDFAHHRKKSALRTGGVVLLRRLITADDASATIRSFDILLEREKDGTIFVAQDVGVCLMPPPPGTMLVSEALVALKHDMLTITSMTDAVTRMRPAVEQACVFGKGGIIITGEDKDGGVMELVLGGEEVLSVDDIIYSLEQNIDPELATIIRKAKTPWYLVPFFRADVDAERTSRISAQRASNKLHYGDGVEEDFSWTRSNVVMRAYGDEWVICETAVISDAEDTEAVPLIDLVEW